MRNIFKRTAEKERKEEKEREYLYLPHSKSARIRVEEAKNKSSDADWKCEEAIIEEKERFGRVRTSRMKDLQKTYFSFRMGFTERPPSGNNEELENYQVRI